MHSPGQKARAKISRRLVVYGVIIVTVSACLSAIGVVSTLNWYRDGFTDTFYFTGAFVCGVPGIFLGMMYFCYFAKAMKHTGDTDLLNLENHIARFTLVILALGLYSIPMAITGIVKHSDNVKSIHLIFSISILLVCLSLFCVGVFFCLSLTSHGIRVQTVKYLTHEIRYKYSVDGSDSNETVFTVFDGNISDATAPTDTVGNEESAYL